MVPVFQFALVYHQIRPKCALAMVFVLPQIIAIAHWDMEVKPVTRIPQPCAMLATC